MDDALVIGGTRFIGRHLVERLRGDGYDVTIFNRGSHENPFESARDVSHVEGDRTDDRALTTVAEQVDPDVVFDVVAYHPGDVETATNVFSDVEAYVYVSSGSAYAEDEIPKREGETSIEPCSAEQATDDSSASYGNRKAEGDRAVRRGAEQGIRAMSVRPPIVYGPHDYTERLDYWLHRVDTYDRIVLPGDGTNLWHRAYVGDVATALVTVAERGTAGEAYNVGDRNAVTLGRMVDLIADEMGEAVDVVHASARELDIADLALTDFPLYRPYPHLLSTAKLSSLGWEATPPHDAMADTVTEYRRSDRDGRGEGPDRDDEERLLGVLDTL